MALIDDAVLAISNGHFHTAPTGTALPTDIRNVGEDWDEMGHTSIEDVLSVDSEGGESTVLGTLQNKSLRSAISPRVETFAMVLQQFDAPAQKLYYGSNAVVDEFGLVAVPNDPVPTTCAWLATFYDGDDTLVFYAPKAEIFRADSFEIGGDGETLASLPLGVKPLQHGTNTWQYKSGLFVAA